MRINIILLLLPFIFAASLEEEGKKISGLWGSKQPCSLLKNVSVNRSVTSQVTQLVEYIAWQDSQFVHSTWHRGYLHKWMIHGECLVDKDL